MRYTPVSSTPCRDDTGGGGVMKQPNACQQRGLAITTVAGRRGSYGQHYSIKPGVGAEES